MSIFLGLDTSNYTTSAALYDSAQNSVVQKKKLLPVAEGERGLRQSDAVFHHTKALPGIVEELFAEKKGVSLSAVSASVKPTTAVGSYMPCFLVGEGFARSLAAVGGLSFHGFSHQQGHLAAAAFSAGALDLLKEPFLAFHVSGGTTDVLLSKPDGNIFSATKVGGSNDLKAGQAIDRIGVRMGLPFPCGKAIEELAKQSDESYHNRIRIKDGCCSLSGLENKAVEMLLDGSPNEDVALFLLSYIADAMEALTLDALERNGDLPLLFAGGVMSDTLIQKRLSARFDAHFAEPEFSCDNAAGIALLGCLEENK